MGYYKLSTRDRGPYGDELRTVRRRKPPRISTWLFPWGRDRVGARRAALAKRDELHALGLSVLGATCNGRCIRGW
jgi:hypothetical protein